MECYYTVSQCYIECCLSLRTFVFLCGSHYAVRHDAECHYAECLYAAFRYAEYRGAL